MKNENSVIQFNHLSYKYNDGAGYALRDINLAIKKGEFIVVTGRSGSGKTSITKCINGLIPYFYPDGVLEGEVYVDGLLVKDSAIQDLCPTIASVFQDPRSQFFTNNSTSEIAFGCENIQFPQEKIIKKIAYVSHKLNLYTILDRNLFDLSSGEKQKVAIASVYAMEPSIFIMDEPSANLDVDSIKDIKTVLENLKDRGHTIIVVEHRLYYLKDLADRIIYMDEGRIKHEWHKEAIEKLRYEQLCDAGLRSLDLEKIKVEEKTHNGKIENLCVEDIHFAYKKSSMLIKGISFKAYQGEIIGIVGKNGSGKTTFAKLICGLLKESKGRVVMNGKPIKHKKRLGKAYFVMQEADFQLFADSVQAELEIGLRKNKQTKEKVREVLEELNLVSLKEEHPMALSGGQKQRVTIGAAIMSSADIVLFDEPTSGLDKDHMMGVNHSIKSLSDDKKTVLVISHDYEFLVECCNRIIHLQDGCIVEDFKLQNGTIDVLKKIML